MTYSALIERLEKEGGSRELDAAIWYAVVEKPQPGDKIDKDMARNRWPHYTTLFEDIVDLITRRLNDPGLSLERIVQWDGWTATINVIDARAVTGKAKAPAAALSAAFLRALEDGK